MIKLYLTTLFYFLIIDTIGIQSFVLKLYNKNLPSNLKINFDKRKPNGTPRKVLNVSLAKKYGWKSKTSLNEAFEKVYLDYLKNTP